MAFELQEKSNSMKKLRNISVDFSLAILFALFGSTDMQAQNLDKSVVQNFIRSKEFVFKAQAVLPMTGQGVLPMTGQGVLPMTGMFRQLTSDYDVKFLGDSIVAYLPYFGRAYSAGYGERGGIDFTSTKFDYNVRQRRKGGWDITIKPNDAKDVRLLNFTVSEDGYATLQVTSNNRQPISFNGYIVERKRK